ncbi:DNA-binding protein [Bordetella muralis]
MPIFGTELTRVLNIRISTMATKAKAPAKKVSKTAAKAPATKAAAKKAPAKKATAAKTAAVKTVAAPVIKEALNKSQLVAHLVAQTGVEAKSVKAVLAGLENAALGSVNKKGVGEFSLPGLLKVTVQKVPAKAKRFGKDPFTGQERWFPAKPASVKVKVRPLKKLKDAAQ